MCFARIQAPRSKLRGACGFVPKTAFQPLLQRQTMPLNEVEFRNEFKAAFQFICIEKVAIICYNTVSKVLFLSDAKGGNQTITGTRSFSHVY